MTPMLLTDNASTDTEVRAAESATNVPQHRDVPLSMPKDQQYYWTQFWQSEEAGALADVQAGQFLEFSSDDPSDVANWLRQSDDENE